MIGPYIFGSVTGQCGTEFDIECGIECRIECGIECGSEYGFRVVQKQILLKSYSFREKLINRKME